MLDAVETFVVPTHEQLRPAVWEKWQVDPNGLRLADAVESADTLLSSSGLSGKSKKHEMMCELEVAPFTADL